MAKNDNLTDFLTDLADAIRAKKSTTSKINPQDFADEIASISGGGGGDEPQPEGTHKVQFLDVDGTVLKTEYVVDGGSATAPANPTREKCTFVEWMDDFSNVTEDMIIFPQWVSTDGYTHYQISASEGDFVRLNIQNSASTKPVTVHWGDGSSVTLENNADYQNIEHCYTSAVDGWIDLIGEGEYVCAGYDYISNFAIVGVVYGSFKNLKSCSLQMINLRYAVIPNTVTSVQSQDPFLNCKKLKYLAFPDSLPNCNMSSGLLSGIVYCRMPKKATSINTFFKGCYNLKEITIPEGVTTLPSYGFARGAHSLERVNLGSALTTIGSGSFAECYLLDDIVIPDTVTSIGDEAFQYCFALKSINLPKGLTGLSSNTFANCPSLRTVTIPDTVTSIGYCCFGGCGSLIPDYDFSKLTSVGNYAFYNCINLTGDLRLTGLTSIPDGAFYNTGISSLYATATNIAAGGAFRYCQKLKRVELPNIVTVGNLVFSDCVALELAIIGDTCTTIGATMFQNCIALKRVVIKATTPPALTSTAFWYTPSLQAIYVPDAAVDTYKAATNWSAYADKILPLSQYAE